MTAYSDQIYHNAAGSLHRHLQNHPALATVDVRLGDEFEPSRGYQKPFLLLFDRTPRWDTAGIDGGFWRDDVDLQNGRVDTIHASLGVFDFALDLGTDEKRERAQWGAVIDRIFEDAETEGIPVYDLFANSESTATVGRMRFTRELDVVHNLLPEHPEVRTWRDVIRFTPDYIHLFVKAAGQPLLTGIELKSN